MKVLMLGVLPVEIGGKYTTGVGNVVYELCKRMADDVELVVYAANMDDKKSHYIGKAHLRGSKLRPFYMAARLLTHPTRTCKEWRFYKQRCFSNPVRYDAYRDNIERIINEVKPDIIHCMDLRQMASAYFANRGRRVPIVLTLHGVHTENGYEDRAGVSIADYVTGLTPQTMAGIKELGRNMNRVFMIPNGTDTSKFFFSEEQRVLIRKELNVDDDTTVMVTIGSLSHRKGQFSFINKLMEMPRDFKYLYIIIGSGTDEEKIKAFITDNNIQDRVKLIGYVSNNQLYSYHSAADVYVHASRWEGQALSEVEAYATDLKIALNRDIVDTVITDTTNRADYFVFDFDQFNVESFVQWATTHKTNRKTRSNYDWMRITDMYVDLYKKILNS